LRGGGDWSRRSFFFSSASTKSTAACSMVDTTVIMASGRARRRALALLVDWRRCCGSEKQAVRRAAGRTGSRRRPRWTRGGDRRGAIRHAVRAGPSAAKRGAGDEAGAIRRSARKGISREQLVLRRAALGGAGHRAGASLPVDRRLNLGGTLHLRFRRDQGQPRDVYVEYTGTALTRVVSSPGWSTDFERGVR